MGTTIIDVKFDEESKSELRIGLPYKEKPENAENFRKIIELLVEKNGEEKNNTEIVFSGKKYIDYMFSGIFWGSQASEMTNLTFFFVKHFFRAKLLK